MAYHWVPVSGAFSREALDGADLLRDFDDKGAAEEWMTLFYEELLHEGVAEVSLYEEDRLVYGPMSLEA